MSLATQRQSYLDFGVAARSRNEPSAVLRGGGDGNVVSLPDIEAY